jgi:TRAP-type C4-dicarboxylate transport system permease small subunit
MIFRKPGIIFDVILEIFRFLAMLLIVCAWFFTCIEVFLRYFFNHPQAWTLELVEYSLLYITFLGSAWVLKQEQHVIMDLVISKFSPETQNIINAITSILAALICIIMSWYAGRAAWNHFGRGSVTPKLLEFPLYPLLGIICLGYGLLFVQFMRRAYGFMKRRTDRPGEQKGEPLWNGT